MADVAAAVRLAGAHRHEVGYIMRRLLERAETRGELYTIGEAGMAYVWHRRDGQTTLHAICVGPACRGQLVGSSLLFGIVADARARGQRLLLARCPVGLPANDWYTHRGFRLERVETGKHRALHVWVLDIAEG